MTFREFVPLLLGTAVASVSGVYLRYLINKDKDEDCYEHTTFEASEIEMKVPKSCFSVKSSESEIVIREIEQKTNTKVILREGDESNICKIEGGFKDRERAKSLLYAIISNRFAGLLEEIECLKKYNSPPERNKEKNNCAANITIDSSYVDDGIVTLPGFKLIQVFVSSVIDPGCFWVQLIDSKATELEEVEKEINAFYDVPENCKLHALGDVSVNDMVAAPFNDDPSLYRARVMEVVNSEKGMELELFYVDYGDDERIAIERAFSLKPEFLKLKFQAVRCSLADIEPRRKQWSDEATQFFCEITAVAKWKAMEAKVVDIGENGEPMLELFEKNHARVVNVADELVRRNHARVVNIDELVRRYHASYCNEQVCVHRKRAQLIVAGGEEDDYYSDDELEIVC